jgi:hypothetical protein
VQHHARYHPYYCLEKRYHQRDAYFTPEERVGNMLVVIELGLNNLQLDRQNERQNEVNTLKDERPQIDASLLLSQLFEGLFVIPSLTRLEVLHFVLLFR